MTNTDTDTDTDTDDDSTDRNNNGPPAATVPLEVIYGTKEYDPATGLMAAFSDLIADAGTVNLELIDTTIVAGDGDSEQQVGVAFGIVVAYELPFERAETVSKIALEPNPEHNTNSNNDNGDATNDDSNTTDTDIELAPEFQEATEAVVTFHPQMWKDDYAVTGGDTETYTLPIEDVVTDDGKLPADNTDESDALAWHDDAPERARNWQGPFYVTVGDVR